MSIKYSLFCENVCRIPLAPNLPICLPIVNSTRQAFNLASIISILSFCRKSI